MDLEKGRKSVGGKVEVKIKIREPLVDKDAEIVKERWLVLESHLRSLDIVSIWCLAKSCIREMSFEKVMGSEERLNPFF